LRPLHVHAAAVEVHRAMSWCPAISPAAVCGSLRRTTGLAATVSPWHFSGTFFWFRNDVIFGNGSDTGPAARCRHVEQQWGGTEAWPSLQLSRAHSACLFLDDAGDLYDPRYWDEILRPAFRAWRNARAAGHCAL
jgi:hypothetical protein